MSAQYAADIFDTAEGRSALEYVKAVLASGASTGFSIGFVPRASEMVTVDNKTVERFTEIELREVSITPMPAVPGAEIASARNEVEEVVSERTDDDLLTLAARVTLDALSESQRHAVLSRYLPPTRTETASPVTPVVIETPSSTEATVRYASLAERASAVRSTYTTH